MDNNDSNWKAMSDTAILENIGKFVRHHRLKQNKSQSQLAQEAGINRTTLVDFEHGKRSNILTLIQLFRALSLLYKFESFQVQYEPSPLQLAKAQEATRKNAYSPRKKKNKPKSGW